jgi:hypothetical protein
VVIRFTKGKDKQDTLSCLRDDGSTTWERARAGVLHDLIHYVVETTLGYREAFYGLLAAGWDIQEFGEIDPRTGRKPAIPVEAGRTEGIVGLLQMDVLGVARFEEGVASLAEWNLPHLAPEILDRMRQDIHALHQQWEQVPPGGHIELLFETSAGSCT